MSDAWYILNARTFFRSGSLVVPAGITKMLATLVGGGGSGGGSNDGRIGGGGGGSGHIVVCQPIIVVPGETLTIAVGDGGAAVYDTTSPYRDGDPGGDTILTGSLSGLRLVASGGNGGHGNTSQWDDVCIGGGGGAGGGAGFSSYSDQYGRRGGSGIAPGTSPDANASGAGITRTCFRQPGDYEVTDRGEQDSGNSHNTGSAAIVASDSLLGSYQVFRTAGVVSYAPGSGGSAFGGQQGYHGAYPTEGEGACAAGGGAAGPWGRGGTNVQNSRRRWARFAHPSETEPDYGGHGYCGGGGAGQRGNVSGATGVLYSGRGGDGVCHLEW